MSARTFAWIAILEAASFVLLMIAMVFKYGFDNEAGVSVMGPIHGVLFLAYVAGALIARSSLNWSLATTAKIIVAGIIPIAGFFVAERLMKESAPTTAAS